MFDVARYFTTRDIQTARAQGYDYILAGNGVFKRARSRHVEATIQIAPARVAGLLLLETHVRLLEARLPESFLWAALQDARRAARARPAEAMYHIVRIDGNARLLRPPQTPTGGRIAYEGGDDPAIVCDLHSHCEMRAFFSPTDDGDELGFRFYATMGRIFTRPEIVVRLGMYGDFAMVPVTDLFAGPGPFVDGGQRLWSSRSGL